MTAAGSGFATASSGMPSTKTSRSASARACTVRPGNGSRRRGHRPGRWPGRWPAQPRHRLAATWLSPSCVSSPGSGMRRSPNSKRSSSRPRTPARPAATGLAGGGSCHGMTWAAWSRALVMEADGEPGGALAILAARWDRCLSSGIGPQCPALGADLVRLALTAGDLGRARDTAATVTRMACGGEVPWLTGAALRCRGLAEDDAEILQAAADAYAPAARPLYLALACEDAGAAFARLGQQDRSRPLLERAIGIYERLRAARDLARAGAALRGAGVRRGQRGARGRPQIGWPSLTPTEHTVAGLVTEGLSNPQIGERLY